MTPTFYPFPVVPHITSFEFEGDVNTGDSVQLTCYVSKGDTPLTILWMVNGKKVELLSGVSTVPIGQRTSLLTINSVEAHHAGEYQCLALNEAGQSTHSAILNVNGILLLLFVNFKPYQTFTHYKNP